MAPLLTHLVIGERVYPQIRFCDVTPSVYGAFLAGCVLVDVNSFSQIDRRITHFVGRLPEDGEAAFRDSCSNFLNQLGEVVRLPWETLARTEQAFIAGYLCHLAGDEIWKELTWKMLQSLGIASPIDLPVPGEVILTTFSVLSGEMFVDYPSVRSTLNIAEIPDIFTHVSWNDFQRTWQIAQPYLLSGHTLDAYFEFLKRKGMSANEIEQAREQHEAFGDKAAALIGTLGGVEAYIRASVDHSLLTICRLGKVDA